MTKNWKKNFGSKTTINPSLGLHKERPSCRRSLQLPKRPSNTSKHELVKKKFLLLWVIFVLLGPDPDSESGSGSTDPIESGSNPDPDPQPCFSHHLIQSEQQSSYPPVLRIRDILIRILLITFRRFFYIIFSKIISHKEVTKQ
jgi:hypothetical protein